MFFFFWDSTVFETKTSFHPRSWVGPAARDWFLCFGWRIIKLYVCIHACRSAETKIYTNEHWNGHQIKTGKDGLSVVIIFCVYVHIYILCVCLFIYSFIYLLALICTLDIFRYFHQFWCGRILTFFHMNVQCAFRTSTTNATRHGEVGLSSQWDGSPLRPGGWLPHAMSLLGHCGSI